MFLLCIPCSNVDLSGNTSPITQPLEINTPTKEKIISYTNYLKTSSKSKSSSRTSSRTSSKASSPNEIRRGNQIGETKFLYSANKKVFPVDNYLHRVDSTDLFIENMKLYNNKKNEDDDDELFKHMIKVQTNEIYDNYNDFIMSMNSKLQYSTTSLRSIDNLDKSANGKKVL
jgi:hypothetical protein